MRDGRCANDHIYLLRIFLAWAGPASTGVLKEPAELARLFHSSQGQGFLGYCCGLGSEVPPHRSRLWERVGGPSRWQWNTGISNLMYVWTGDRARTGDSCNESTVERQLLTQETPRYRVTGVLTAMKAPKWRSSTEESVLSVPFGIVRMWSGSYHTGWVRQHEGY